MKNPGVNLGELYGTLVPDFKLISIKDHDDDTDDNTDSDADVDTDDDERRKQRKRRRERGRQKRKRKQGPMQMQMPLLVCMDLATRLKEASVLPLDCAQELLFASWKRQR